MSAMLHGAAERVNAGKQVGLILGDMFELGSFAEKYHREIGQLVAKIKPKFLVAVGPLARFYVEEVISDIIGVYHTESAEAAAKIAYDSKFEVLYVKASRGMKLEESVKEIVRISSSLS